MSQNNQIISYLKRFSDTTFPIDMKKTTAFLFFFFYVSVVTAQEIIYDLYQKSDCVLLLTVTKNISKCCIQFELPHHIDSVFIEIKSVYKGKFTQNFIYVEALSENGDTLHKFPNFLPNTTYFVFLKRGQLIDRHAGYIMYNPLLEQDILKIKKRWYKPYFRAKLTKKPCHRTTKL